MPFQPENVTINQFALDMIGAKAELTGELTIPEGTGMPVGKVNGTFTGVNDLLEKLANMGFMPQEQLMGARMMIAMFARPAEGRSRPVDDRTRIPRRRVRLCQWSAGQVI